MTKLNANTASPRARSRPKPGPIALAIAALSLLALTGYAGRNAARALGIAFPSLLVDPFGSYSAVYLPGWGSDVGSHTARFPDRLVAVDRTLIPSPPKPMHTAREILRLMDSLRAAGRKAVVLTFRRPSGEQYGLQRSIRRLGPDDVVFFFGLYAVVAILVLWSGVMVLVLAQRRAGANAYAVWCVGAVLFLITFFDYHTTFALVPLFSLSVVWIAAGFLALAWYFPDPPLRWRLLPLRAALLVASVAAAAWLALAPLLDIDPLRTRLFAIYAAPAAGLALVAALVARLVRGNQGHRRELRSALWGIAAVPAVASVGLALPSVNGVGVIHLIAPFLVPLIPLSIGYALIRHNILATRELLTRRMLLVPVVSTAFMGAIVVWLSWRGAINLLGNEQATPLALAALTFALIALAGYRLALRLFFTATGKFRPTIEQLTDAISTRGDAESIRHAIESAVCLWLPAPAVSVVEADRVASIASLPGDHLARLSAGDLMWTSESAWTCRLLVPLRSLGQLRGVILVSRGDNRALLTSEDAALLSAIASVGAVALHNAEVVSHLDALRRLEVGVSRDEKLRALGAVGAELSHEIMGPLGFFRFLLERASGGRPLERDDIDTGQAEVERLARMLGNLRRFHPPTPQLRSVSVSATVQRVLRLLGSERFADGGLCLAMAIDDQLMVRADPDAFLQVLYNLLKNAVEAVGERGSIEVRTTSQPDGTPVLEIWDSGPGVPSALEKSMFNPWVTTKPTGTGLGLVITHRIVRSFDWTLTYHRSQDRTCFAIGMARRELETTGEGRQP